MSNYIWTDEGKAFVAKRWAEGASAEVIARELGVTRNSVIGRVHRSKLPKRITNGQEKVRRAPRGLVVRRAPAKPPRTPYIEPEYIPVDPILFILRRMGLGRQCAFIADDPMLGARAPEIMCCGAQTVGGTSWCYRHFALVSQPVTKKDRRSDNGRSPSRFIGEGAA